MQNLSSNIHYIEEHEASMLVLVLLRQMNETVLFVERDGGEIGIKRGTRSIIYQHHLIFKCFLASATSSSNFLRASAFSSGVL